MHWFWRTILRLPLITTTSLASLTIIIAMTSFWMALSADVSNLPLGFGADPSERHSRVQFWVRTRFAEGWLSLSFQFGEPIGGSIGSALPEWWGTYQNLGQNGTIYWWIRIPMWQPIILFAIYPTIAFIRGPVRRYRRRRKGRCRKCGYNLTGNTTGICPECGETIPHGDRLPEETTDDHL